MNHLKIFLFSLIIIKKRMYASYYNFLSIIIEIHIIKTQNTNIIIKKSKNQKIKNRYTIYLNCVYIV